MNNLIPSQDLRIRTEGDKRSLQSNKIVYSNTDKPVSAPSLNQEMGLVRALYVANGKKTRGYRTHFNRDGKPLCGCRYREFTSHSAAQDWVPVAGNIPTCPVCIRRCLVQEGEICR